MKLELRNASIHLQWFMAYIMRYKSTVTFLEGSSLPPSQGYTKWWE